MGRLRLDEAVYRLGSLGASRRGWPLVLWDLFYTREPLADDTPLALLTLYGPMLGFAEFQARKRSGQLSEAVKAGLTVACVTFTILYVANLS